MLLYDATHTSHTRAQTGIQRVVRSLHRTLAQCEDVTPICFDPYLRAWRPLQRDERRLLEPGGEPASSRGSKWSLAQKIAGHAARLARRRPKLPPASGFVCPELFSPRVGAHLSAVFMSVRGPRVAIFHDAIGLQFPELTPPGTVSRLPAYLRELLQFDGIAAVSEESAGSLRDYWQWLGIAAPPPVIALPLGMDELPDTPTSDPPAGARPRLLCVATIEGRKNHTALLTACEELWTQGLDFELELVGLARPDTAAIALALIRRLQAAGRPLLLAGAVTDAELHAAYRRCTITVYPSLREGFGLPVLESLRHGRPCVCSGQGAIGESAREGGCVRLESLDVAALAEALGNLLRAPARVAELRAAAQRRTFRSWPQYAARLADWMKSLPLRR